MDTPPFATSALTTFVCIMIDDFDQSQQCEDTEEGRSSSSLTPQELSGPSFAGENDHRAAVSILDRLRAPTQSDLGRKRKILANSIPPVGKKRSVSQERKFDPHTVQPAQRVSEFPGEQLCVCWKAVLQGM